MLNQKTSLPIVIVFALLQALIHYTGHQHFATLLSFVTILFLAVLLFSKTRLKGRFHKRMFIGLLLTAAGFAYFYFVPRYTEIKSSLFFYVLPQLYFLNAFYLDFKSAPALDKTGARIAIATAFCFSISYYMLMRGDLGMLRLPFMIGLFCSSFLYMMACFRNQRVNKESFNLMLTGVVILVVAEAFFAYHAFKAPIINGDLTYQILSMMAYTVIVLGSIERKLIHPEGT